MKNAVIYILFISMVCLASKVCAFDFDQLQVHGFVSQGFLKSDKNKFLYADTEDGSFEFNEVGISFSKELTNNLRLGMQLISRDLGEFGNNEVEVDWAFADYRMYNWLGFRIGKIKIPYGIFNQFRDIDAARTNILLPQNIYYEVHREAAEAMTSIGIYGILAGGIEYSFLFGTIDIDSEGGIAKDMAGDFEPMGILLSDVDVDDRSFLADLKWNAPLKVCGSVDQ